MRTCHPQRLVITASYEGGSLFNGLPDNRFMFTLVIRGGGFFNPVLRFTTKSHPLLSTMRFFLHICIRGNRQLVAKTKCASMQFRVIRNLDLQRTTDLIIFQFVIQISKTMREKTFGKLSIKKIEKICIKTLLK